MKPVTSSVIICTRNRLPDMLICLESLRTQTVAPTELIVVDSSTVPLDKEQSFNVIFTPANFPNSRLVYQHTKPGLPYQRNVGTSLAKQQVVYFFDDDVILQPDYLEHMNNTFTKYPHYAGGMGDVTNISSKKIVYNWVKALFGLQRDYASGKFNASGLPTHPYGMKHFMDVEVLGGCCMAYRRAAFALESFDENLGGYAFMEDCDFSRRVSYRAPLFYNPLAKMQHMVSPLARDRVVDTRAMYIKNYHYLFYKNFYPRNRLKLLAFYWSIIGLFVEAIALRNMNYIKGYLKGLRECHANNRQRTPKTIV
ncbi:MAG: glycosyltransferase [Candidatus Dependentiae bacterium]|nr:glycosyltransferase [Candidatus Dependentiae bacterium]